MTTHDSPAIALLTRSRNTSVETCVQPGSQNKLSSSTNVAFIRRASVSPSVDLPDPLVPITTTRCTIPPSQKDFIEGRSGANKVRANEVSINTPTKDPASSG